MSDNMFSFLAKGPGNPSPANTPNSQNSGPNPAPQTEPQRPLILMPDFATVQQRDKASAVPMNMFKPKGLLMGGNRGNEASTSQPQTQQTQAAPKPFRTHPLNGPASHFHPSSSGPPPRPTPQQPPLPHPSQFQRLPPQLPHNAPAPAPPPQLQLQYIHNNHNTAALQPQQIAPPTHPPLNPQPDPPKASANGGGNAFENAFGFVRQDANYNPLPRLEEVERAMPIAPALAATTSIPPHHANSMAPHYPAGSVPIAWNGRVLLVNRRQRGNPVLENVKNVRWQFADDLVPDYQMGLGTCALFLSLRFHMLHKDYIGKRMRELFRSYRLRVLLLLIDSADGGSTEVLQEITNMCVQYEFTLVCAWSPLECARYLETFKAFETKPATTIMEKTETDYVSRLVSVLTSIKGINRTDALSLASHFGSLAALLTASMEQLASVPGVGPKKVRRLYETFHEPLTKAPVRVAAAAPVAAADADAEEEAEAEEALEAQEGIRRTRAQGGIEVGGKEQDGEEGGGPEDPPGIAAELGPFYDEEMQFELEPADDSEEEG